LGLKNEVEGENSQAFDSFQKALNIYKKLNDSEGIFESYNQIGFFYDNRGDRFNALKFYEKCVEIGSQLEDKTVLARFYNNLTVVLKNQGNFLKALEYLYKALSIQEEINDEIGMAISYSSIGLSLFSQHEFDEALKYFLAALKLYQKLGMERHEAHAYLHIGSIYDEKGNADIGLKYYTKALNRNFPKMWEVYLKMGKVYENKNQIDLALHYYNKALQISEKGEFKETLSSALSKIGSLEIKNDNFKEANKHIEKAFALAQELKYPKLIMETASTKVQLAIEKEDYKLAYEMENLRNEMKDKLQNQQARKAIIKHQIKYEYEKQLKQKDIEIEEEKLNNRHLQAQIDLLLTKNKRLVYQNKIINEQLADDVR